MANSIQANDPASLDSLPHRLGSYTELLLRGYSAPKPLTAKEARGELATETRPFRERMTEYISQKLNVEDDEKTIRKHLLAAIEAKGLGISSQLLGQWIPSRPRTLSKDEIFISPQSIFKLCLAMELGIEDSAHFVYDCLYQNWFNYRVASEVIYFFFIGAQDLFGDETYREAQELAEWYRDYSRDAGGAGSAEDATVEGIGNEPASAQDRTGYTRILGDGIRQLLEVPYPDRQAALRTLTDYLKANKALFTNVRRSGIRTYRTYLSGIDDSIIIPLTELYREDTGYTLPPTHYLDMRGTRDYKGSRRLLWGAENRGEWRKANKGEGILDILQEEEIALERHAVTRMLRNGVLRGNMIALLFFHFCLENKVRFKRDGERASLFDRFYYTTNQTLVDSCGMMPLHPRKPFDRLFLLSVAKSAPSDPIEYLNETLEAFYLS